MAFLLEPQDNMEAWHGAHVAERRTPARQSDDTQWSGVLVSLDLAQSGWVCGVVSDNSRFGVRGL